MSVVSLPRARAAAALLGCVAGTAFAAAPVHAAPFGALDQSFGTRGTVVTSLGHVYPTWASGVLVQPDGKIVVAGSTGVADATQGNTRRIALTRYNSNGRLDAGFGQRGVVLDQSPAWIGSGARAVARQRDGRLLVAGEGAWSFRESQAIVVRYNADGSLDSSFGNGGAAGTFAGYRAEAVVVQTDGKIVVAGPSRTTVDEVVLVRYMSDGRVDPSFGVDGDGVATVQVSGYTRAEPQRMVLQRDGRLLVSMVADRAFALVMRVNANGTLDRGFGGSGFARAPFAGWEVGGLKGLALRGDGKIVLAGTVIQSREGSPTTSRVGLARLNVNGSFDASFGSGGTAVRTLGRAPQSGANDVVLQGSRIVVAGTVSGAVDNFNVTEQRRFAIGSFKSDGSVDPTFGTAGATVTKIGAVGGSEPVALAAQPNGMFVAAGVHQVPTSTPGEFTYGEFALARYHPTISWLRPWLP